MKVLDTSAIIPFLDYDHPHHAAAVQDLQMGGLVVSWGTLAETAMVVRENAKNVGLDGNDAARNGLDAITRLSGFREAPPIELREVLDLHRRERRLSFNDAWNLALALHLQAELVAYDRDLIAAWRRLGPRKPT